jgi:hypothetical protein
MIGTFKLFHLTFGIVVDDHTKGAKDPHDAWGSFIQILLDAMLKKRNIDEIFILSHSNPRTKVTDCLRGVTPPSHPSDGGHSWIIPAHGIAFLD